MIQIKIVDTPQEMAECIAIRRTVFIEGQSVPEAREQDGLDGECIHYIAYLEETPAGTMRVRQITPTSRKIERVAVLEEFRGQGIALNMMDVALAEMAAEGVTEALVESQETALPLYTKLGFVAYGERFLDANMPHLKMKKSLKNEE